MCGNPRNRNISRVVEDLRARQREEELRARQRRLRAMMEEASRFPDVPVPQAADIGEEQEEVEFEPLPEEVPVEAPAAPVPVEVPA